MKLTFYKYQGTGNDFVMIDNRGGAFKPEQSLVARLCDRRFGIGGDGLILLEEAEGYDFRMVYFNADGREGSMCGNGGRCTVRFAHFLGLFTFITRFIAVDGEHDAHLEGDWVYLKMKNLSLTDVRQDEDGTYFLNTGSPHVVSEVSALAQYPVSEEGYRLRHATRYAPAGTNVNFIEKIAQNTLAVRTFERGVEAETYSCGTGVTAAALVASKQGYTSPVKIQTLGGELAVSFRQENDTFVEVYLAGPAEQVFKGEVIINP